MDKWFEDVSLREQPVKQGYQRVGVTDTSRGELTGVE